MNYRKNTAKHESNNVVKEQYLLHLKNEFEHLGYGARIDRFNTFEGDCLIFTAKKNAEIIQLRFSRGKKSILGNYSLSSYVNKEFSLETVSSANNTCLKQTRWYNFAKKKFHRKVSSSLNLLHRNYSTYVSAAGGKDHLERKIEGLKKDERYSTSLETLNYVEPAVGIEFDETGAHPVFGLAVGPDSFGGLMLYDPFENTVEVGGYVGFGGMGIGSVQPIRGTSSGLEEVIESSSNSSDTHSSDTCSELSNGHLDCNALDCTDHDCHGDCDGFDLDCD